MLDEARRTRGYHGRKKEEDFDDHFPGIVGFGAFDDDILMEEPEVDVAEDDPSDDLGQALHNVWADYESETETLKFQKMLEDHRKLLYPDFENGLKKLSTTLELMQWNVTNGVSDKRFGELLKFVKKCFLRTTNCLRKRIKPNNLFAL